MEQNQIWTIILIVITVIMSFAGFKDRSFYNRHLLYPRVMNYGQEMHRMITHGFIHADEPHLIFNMIALYSIGSFVEANFKFQGLGMLYPSMYLSGIVVASLPSFFKHRNNPSYSALGASGGVSAVMFSMVYWAPWASFRIFYIIPMWSILFAILYLVYSAYMAKQQRDNIGHDAHFWGGVYGFIFTFAFDPSHGAYFMQQIMHPPF
jgi:membrane associated rhomboid family serine protease